MQYISDLGLRFADQAYEMKGVYRMAVLPPLTDDFVINGGFAAMTFFFIILTIYLIRYRFRIYIEFLRQWLYPQ